MKKWTLLLSLLICFSSYARDLDGIKRDILSLAQSYQGQMDEDGSKQKKLETLISELKSLVPQLSMQQRAVRALGVWHQVWGPYAFDDSNRMPPGIDPANIYQYISGEGFYYNFAEYNFFGINLKSYLKGKYQILDDRINVQFTNHGLVREKEVNYAKLGDDLEAGAVRTTAFPNQIPPAGVKGNLIEVFADHEMRINYGVVGDNISQPALFIMQRIR